MPKQYEKLVLNQTNMNYISSILRVIENTMDIIKVNQIEKLHIRIFDKFYF